MCEAAAHAPVQSYLSDLYPPERRGTIVGILGLSVPLGIVIGGIGGAWIAQHHGWRAAFFTVGFPGLFLAVLVRLTLRDRHRENAGADIPSFRTVLAALYQCRSLRHMLTGALLTSFVGHAVLAFGHPFFVRNFNLSYTEAALYFALVNSASVAGGYMVGGFVVDRFVSRDVRYYGWIPGVMMLLAAPFYIAGFLQRDLSVGIVLLAIPGVFSASYYAPVLAVTQNLVSSRMRATAISIVLLAMSVVGMLLGPVAAGALSDFYYQRALPEGITAAMCRHASEVTALTCNAASAQGVGNALATICLLFLWAGGHYLFATRYLRGDINLNA